MAKQRGFRLKNIKPVFDEIDASRVRGQDEFKRLAKTIIPELIAEGPEKTGAWKRGWKVMNPRQLKHGAKVKLQNRVPYVRRVEFGKRKGGQIPWSRAGYRLLSSKIIGFAQMLKG